MTQNVQTRAIALRPYPWQLEALAKMDTSRYVMLLAHRSAGKTAILCTKLGIRALTTQGPDGKACDFGWCSVSYRQLKRTAYMEMKRLFIDAIGPEAFNDSELKVTFPNGNRVHFLGLSDSSALRGNHFHGLVVDEMQEFAESSDLTTSLFPMLNKHRGFFWGSGTAKGIYNYLYFFWEKAIRDPEWLALKYTPDDTNLIDEERWRAIRSVNTEAEIGQEYYCDFMAQLSSRVYTNFQTATHVRSDIVDRGDEILVGLDFNVSKMVAVLGQHTPDRRGIEIFGEIVLRDTDTATMAQAIRKAYPTRVVTVMPDAAGRQRKTSATGATDITLLRQAGLKISVPNRNPAIADRVNSVQQLLRNPSGEIRLTVSDTCYETIRTLTAHQYNVHTGQPSKDAGPNSYDSAGDALGYLVMATYPIRKFGNSVRELRL